MGVQCGTLRGVGSLAYRTLEGGEESPILNTAHLLIVHWSQLEEKNPCTLHTAHCTTSEGVPLILNVTALDWTALDGTGLHKQKKLQCFSSSTASHDNDCIAFRFIGLLLCED